MTRFSARKQKRPERSSEPLGVDFDNVRASDSNGSIENGNGNRRSTRKAIKSQRYIENSWYTGETLDNKINNEDKSMERQKKLPRLDGNKQVSHKTDSPSKLEHISSEEVKNVDAKVQDPENEVDTTDYDLMPSTPTMECDGTANFYCPSISSYAFKQAELPRAEDLEGFRDINHMYYALHVRKARQLLESRGKTFSKLHKKILLEKIQQNPEIVKATIENYLLSKLKKRYKHGRVRVLPPIPEDQECNEHYKPFHHLSSENKTFFKRSMLPESSGMQDPLRFNIFVVLIPVALLAVLVYLLKKRVLARNLK